MRISDWSSDVCSADLKRLPQRIKIPFIVVAIYGGPLILLVISKLVEAVRAGHPSVQAGAAFLTVSIDQHLLTFLEWQAGRDHGRRQVNGADLGQQQPSQVVAMLFFLSHQLQPARQIGRESCRESVCQYV